MRICLLVEGSYPYVVGGVSSWIQMLITGCPEHEFFVYSIGAEAKDRGKFRYPMPPNVVGVQEEFLDEILQGKCEGMRENILNAHEREALYDLVCGDGEIPFDALIELFHNQNTKREPLEIFMSSDFFDIISRVYVERYHHLPFTDFFWTIRSMLLPLFYLMHQELPEADVYHSVATGYCGVIGGIAALVYKKPFMITEHGIYSREREVEIIKSEWAKGDFKSVWIQYFYNLAKLSYRTADHVYTLFEHNVEIEHDLGCDPSKTAVVPNGIHMKNFEHIPPLVNEPGKPFTIGAVVRVVPIKDIITLIRAFFLVKQEIPDAVLYIMGQYEEDPDYYAQCCQTVDMLGLKDVIFTGSVRVPEYLERMDVLALSSISEGQPLAVLEGQAAHRPFVTTNVGCCRELIYGDSTDTLGEAGIVVAPMDFEEMARAFIYLARNFDRRREMGCIGYERVKQKYTYEIFINSYRDIYRQEKEVTR